MEANVGGVWGTVCDDYFDIRDAQVVCKFLGFPRATAAYHKARFGRGCGFIWFDNLCCAGGESTPFHCPHNGFGIENCEHYEDAGVRCTGKSCYKWTVHAACDLDQQSLNSEIPGHK